MVSTFAYSGKSLTLAPKTSEKLIVESLDRVDLPKATISVNPEATQLAVARLAAAWLLFEAVMRLDSPALLFRRFGFLTIVNSCLLSVLALVQWLTWNGRVLWLRPSPHPDLAWYSGGPFFCHNHLAAYLNLGFGFSIGLMMATLKREFRGTTGRSRRYWPIVIAGIVLTGLVVSHSRGGFLAAFVAMSLMFATQRLRLGTSLLAFAFLGFSAALLVLATGSDSPWSRFLTVLQPLEDIRWDVWRVSIEAWGWRPWLGYGLGSFGWAVAPFTHKDVHAFYQRGENQYIDLLVEEGLIGLGIALTAIGFVIRNARLAIRSTTVPSDRVFLIGGFFGAVALMLHWLTDFSFHIPGVAVSVVVLAALLCRLGLRDGLSWFSARLSRSLRLPISTVFPAMLCFMMLAPAIRNAKVEADLWRSQLPLPDTLAPTPNRASHTPGDLRDQIQVYDRALSLRPDWSEGYLRRGLAYLELYEVTARLWLRESSADLGTRRIEMMADPLWLRYRMVEALKSSDGSLEALLDQDPIRDLLIPAVKSFLEARRCCRVNALAEIEIANLCYLLRSEDPSSRYIERAYALAGANPSLLYLAGQLAIQDGNIDLAALCWRRAIEVNPTFFGAVAIVSMCTLPAEKILSGVIPPDQGHYAVMFATEFNILSPASREILLNGALELIPRDVTLKPSEIPFHNALAYHALDRHADAIASITESLRLDPLKTEYRLRLIQWLSDKQDWEEARNQVNIGLDFDRGNKSLSQWRRFLVAKIAEGSSRSLSIFSR